MKSLYKSFLLNTRKNVILLTIVSLVINTASFIYFFESSTVEQLIVFDFVIPLVLIIVVILNFKFLKNKNELDVMFTLPYDSKKIFWAKYLVSLTHFFIISIVLYFVSLLFYYLIANNLSFFLKFSFHNLLILFIEVISKLVVSFLLFNIILVLFVKSKNLFGSILNLLFGLLLLSYLRNVLVLLIDSSSMQLASNFLVLPFSIYVNISYLINDLLEVSRVIKVNDTLVLLTVLNVIIIFIAATLAILTFIRSKFSYTSINLGINSLISRIIFVVLSALFVLNFCLMFDNPTKAISFSIFTNLILFWISFFYHDKKYDYQSFVLAMCFILIIIIVPIFVYIY